VRDDGYVPEITGQLHVTDCRSASNHSRKRWTGVDGFGRKRKRQVKSSKFGGIQPKKKCCRSKPRCKRCPVVLHKVRKAELSGVRGKALEKVFKRTRKS
jgi:hypothetical protein